MDKGCELTKVKVGVNGGRAHSHGCHPIELHKENTLLRVYQIYAKYVHIVNENKGQYSEGCLDAG